MMNIGLSIEHLHGKKTGVGQYGFHIALNLARIDPENNYVLLSPSPLDKIDIERLTAYPNIQVLDHNLLERYIPRDIILIPLWLQFFLPVMCKQLGLDVYYHTGSIWPLIPFRVAKRQLVFIHDVIPLMFPECYYKHTVYYYRLSRATNLKNFDRVIVNSETTRRDLMMHMRVPEEQIAVTKLAADERFTPTNDPRQNNRVQEKYGLPRSYLLFTGTLEPRKNITRLLEAFARTRSRETLALVIAGKRGWLYKQVFETVKKLNLEDQVILTGFVDDEDLPSVYSLARAFVYPSLYEGFGLPVIEAMACGVPVITSDVPSLREVAGGAAVFVDPIDVDSLARNIDEVVLNDATHRRLCKASLARAQEFTWERTARQTLKLFFD